MPFASNDAFSRQALSEKARLLQQRFGGSSDLVIRNMPFGEDEPVLAALLYIDGLIDAPTVNDIAETIQRTILREDRPPDEPAFADWPSLQSRIPLPAGSIRVLREQPKVEQALLSGDTIVLCEGFDGCIAVDTNGGEKRPVSEPTTETVVRGPREGFTENLRTNIALVRRKIKNADLWVETKQIGRVTKTDVSLMYINGIAQDSVIAEAKARLERIDIDAVLESGYIEELIQDGKYSLFPTMTNSERPDVVAAGLLEGRIAIFVDGTPFVLLAPVFFIQFFQAAEDYYNRYNFSIIRLLRLLSFFIAMLAPGLYIALTTFHQEAIPTPLLISLAAQREGIPFPAFVEAMMMEITFEILREAGVRMPRAIGQAVSIVGALVLGDAAVQAGLVSPAMVIVVSLTAISNFVIPAYDLATTVRLLRFMFMILAATFGLFGISAGIVALVLHLCSLRSFGVPILSPFAPLSLSGQTDGLLRLPVWRQHLRPRFLSPRNKVRERSKGPQKPPARK